LNVVSLNEKNRKWGQISQIRRVSNTVNKQNKFLLENGEVATVVADRNSNIKLVARLITEYIKEHNEFDDLMDIPLASNIISASLIPDDAA
tara:strand:+ start:1983 stop:2255 length:273 start_codon:yes stop_codon:yes gene_type:complete